MNKPTKATISELKSAIETLEFYANGTVTDTATISRAVVVQTRDAVARALKQLTQDDALPCGARHCSVKKPTARALAAHRRPCIWVMREGRDTNDSGQIGDPHGSTFVPGD